MKQVWHLGLGAALVLLASCAGKPPAAPSADALLPQVGESADAFESRCVAYVTDHASYAQAGGCMDKAATMRLASAPRPSAASAVPATAAASVVHAAPESASQGSESLVAAGRACGTTIEDASADGGKTVAITVSGLITSGCKERLDSTVADATAKFPKAQLYFVLNSPGGALQTAVQMGEIIEKDRLPVVVPPNAMCASACFLILAASHTKYVSPSAHVGVHSAAEAIPGNETEGSKAVTTDFARILSQLGVPSEIIGRLVETPPGAMYWLTPEELMTMGVRLLPT
jgi:hypothetical protein